METRADKKVLCLICTCMDSNSCLVAHTGLSVALTSFLIEKIIMISYYRCMIQILNITTTQKTTLLLIFSHKEPAEAEARHFHLIKLAFQSLPRSPLRTNARLITLTVLLRQSICFLCMLELAKCPLLLTTTYEPSDHLTTSHLPVGYFTFTPSLA